MLRDENDFSLEGYGNLFSNLYFLMGVSRIDRFLLETNYINIYLEIFFLCYIRFYEYI